MFLTSEDQLSSILPPLPLQPHGMLRSEVSVSEDHLSVPVSSSGGSDIGDSSDMSLVPSLTWPPALSTKVLYRAPQS